MKAARWLSALAALVSLPLCTGCLVPQSQLAACQSQNRILAEQTRAQLAEIENLKIHGRNTEDQLARTEEEMAMLQEQNTLERKQLANYQRERSELHEQFQGLANSRGQMPAKLTEQLIDLSKRHPSLHFDPASGVSKLDTDILFDSGAAGLKPAAETVLGEFVRILKSPEAGDLKIMVVGHTDHQPMATKPLRDQFPNNFHLSTARALAVADFVRRHGIPEQRIGVAGFGAHQPIAPNATATDRQKNRRVEIFVMNRDVPVVGWTDSMPSVY